MGVVGWFPTVVIIRLSQPPAGDWLAGAWTELGNKTTTKKEDKLNSKESRLHSLTHSLTDSITHIFFEFSNSYQLSII